jgi:hypothetical protein
MTGTIPTTDLLTQGLQSPDALEAFYAKHPEGYSTQDLEFAKSYYRQLRDKLASASPREGAKNAKKAKAAIELIPTDLDL